MSNKSPQDPLSSLCLAVRDSVCVYGCLCILLLFPPTIPCLVPLSLSLSLPVSLTSSSSPQKHSFVRLSRFPAEVCGLRNPLQSGPLSGAVPAVGEACCQAQREADLMDIWASRRGRHKEAQVGQQKLLTSIALSHSCSFISAPSLCDFHLFRLSVSCLVFLVVCFSWINLHLAVVLKSHTTLVRFFYFLILTVQTEVLGLDEENELKALCNNEFFISIVVRDATRWISHKQLKVI